MTDKKTGPIYEQQVDRVAEAFRTYQKRDPRSIVEVGARDCKETVAFAQLFPQAQIHAFECDPITLPLCRERISGISNITLHEIAVSDSVGSIDFFKIPDDPGSSSALQHNTMTQEKVTVPCTTLAKEFSVSPDILWMDAQGSELNILKGAGATLKNIDIIHSEVYFAQAYRGQPLYAEIRNFLNAHGFDLLSFSSYGRNFGDAIFINRNIYKRKTPQWFTEVSSMLKERLIGHTRGLMIRTGIR